MGAIEIDTHAIDTEARDANLAGRLRNGRFALLIAPAALVSLLALFMWWVWDLSKQPHGGDHFVPIAAALIPTAIAIAAWTFLIRAWITSQGRREKNRFRIIVDPIDGLLVIKGEGEREREGKSSSSPSPSLHVTDLTSIDRIDCMGDTLWIVSKDQRQPRRAIPLLLGNLPAQRALADRLNQLLIEARTAGGYRGILHAKAPSSPPPPHVRIDTLNLHLNPSSTENENVNVNVNENQNENDGAEEAEKPRLVARLDK